MLAIHATFPCAQDRATIRPDSRIGPEVSMAARTAETDSTTPLDQRLLTLSEVSEHLGVPLRTLHSWIADDRLAVVRLGPRTFRILESDLLTFIEAARQAAKG